MKPGPRKLTRRNIAGHQHCGICHPKPKNQKQRARWLIRKWMYAQGVPLRKIP